jgi:hypothetical protein
MVSIVKVAVKRRHRPPPLPYSGPHTIHTVGLAPWHRFVGTSAPRHLRTRDRGCRRSGERVNPGAADRGPLGTSAPRHLGTSDRTHSWAEVHGSARSLALRGRYPGGGVIRRPTVPRYSRLRDPRVAGSPDPMSMGRDDPMARWPDGPRYPRPQDRGSAREGGPRPSSPGVPWPISLPDEEVGR